MTENGFLVNKRKTNKQTPVIIYRLSGRRGGARGFGLCCDTI